MVALAPDAAGRTPDDPLHRAYNEGVRALVDTFAELAAADGRPAAEDRLRTLFAAMVGSSMLARSARGEGCTTRHTYSGSGEQRNGKAM